MVTKKLVIMVVDSFNAVKQAQRLFNYIVSGMSLIESWRHSSRQIVITSKR